MTSPIPQYGNQPVTPQRVQTDPSATYQCTKYQHPSVILEQWGITSTPAQKIQKGISCDHRFLATTHRGTRVSERSPEKVCPSQRTNVIVIILNDYIIVYIYIFIIRKEYTFI